MSDAKDPSPEDRTTIGRGPSADPAADRIPNGPQASPTPVDPATAFSRGQIIDDRYLIDGWLGRGGMGEVWRAFDLKLQVEVALKSLLGTREGGAEIRDRTSRERLWSGIRETPPRLPDSPWHAVLRRAVDADPERRYPSARALARALEEVTLAAEGADDRTPYPGLATFTEVDAEYFFGREAEVEAVVKKLGRLHLQAIIGPSGTGKSSFLRAGAGFGATLRPCRWTAWT